MSEPEPDYVDIDFEESEPGPPEPATPSLEEIADAGQKPGDADREKQEAKREEARKLIATRSFDFASPPPTVPPTYCLAGVGVAHPGNLVVIVGDRGAGKSSFFAAGLAAPMAANEEADCLGFESSNSERRAVLHLDTEQSLEHFDALVRRSLRRAEVEQPPAWLNSVCLTGCEPLEIIEVLATLLHDATGKYGGIHSVWLDGIGDLANSPNDELESNRLVRKLHALAIQYGCPIFAVLHLNPGSDFKSRGHLGSQIERKAETVLKLKKEVVNGREVVTAFTGKAREKPIFESSGPRFTWSDEAGMHRSCASRAEAGEAEKAREYRDLAVAIWREDPEATLPYREVVARIVRLSETGRITRSGKPLKADAAKKRVAQLCKYTVIQNSLIPGSYLLSDRVKYDLHCESAQQSGMEGDLDAV